MKKKIKKLEVPDEVLKQPITKSLAVSPTLVSDEDLEQLSKGQLDKILVLYKVDLKNKERKLTDAYKKELILEAQTEYYNAHGKTPIGLKDILGKDYQQSGSSVSIDMGFTISMGQYQSLKIGGMLTLPVNFTPEEANEAITAFREGMLMFKEEMHQELPVAKDEFARHYSKNT